MPEVVKIGANFGFFLAYARYHDQNQMQDADKYDEDECAQEHTHKKELSPG